MTNKEAAFILSDKTKEMLNKQSIDCKIPDSPDYKSPIELIMGDIQTQIDNDTVKAVQSYGFNVDKAELEKALKYDREQYSKGYADARMKYERPHGEWITENVVKPYGVCNLCGVICEIDNFCGNCGADMRKETDNE